MTTSEARPQPATDPMDLAYGAALEALAAGADFAEWVVALVAAVATHPDVRDGELVMFPRPGSWETDGVAGLLASSGAEHIPDAYRREERPALHELPLADVARWTADGLRQLSWGSEVASRADELADEINTTHFTWARSVSDGDQS